MVCENFIFDAVTLDCTLKKGYKMAGKRQFWVKMGAHGVSFCMWTLIFGHITCLGHKNALAKYDV